MSERGKPFPEIARFNNHFPPEPKLKGVPHAAKQSIFLDTPGLSQAMDVIVDLQRKDINSRERRAYMDKIKTVQKKERDRLVSGLNSIFEIGEDGKSLTESETIKKQAGLILERLEPEKDEGRGKLSFEHEYLNALLESDVVRSHLEPFHRYINLPEKKRDNIVASVAGELFKDPRQLLRHARRASGIGEDLKDDPSHGAQAYLAYNQEVKQALVSLAGRPELAPLDRRSLVQWLKVLGSGTQYEKIAERLLSGWIAEDEPELVIDRMHQLVTASYTSGNETVISQMLEIESLDTDILPFDSLAAIEYVGGYRFGSQTVLQQRAEIADAAAFLSPQHRRAVARNSFKHVRQVLTPAFKKRKNELILKLLKEGRKEDIEQMRRMGGNRKAGETFRQVMRRVRPQKDVKETDGDLITDSLLRRWINEQISNDNRTEKLFRKRIITGEIQLPGISRVIKAPLPQVVSEIQNCLSGLPAQELDQPENWRTLALLVPKDLNQKHIDKLKDVNKKMRQQIKDERLRGLSDRGDRIYVTNQQLQELGFSAIEIHPEEENGYKVRVELGDKVFVGKMDKDWRVIDTRFDSPMLLPITGSFLEQVILGHVHELLCGPAEIIAFLMIKINYRMLKLA